MSTKLTTAETPGFNTHINKRKPEYQSFNRQVLVHDSMDKNKIIFNPSDFPFVELELVKGLFDTPLNFQAEEDQELRRIVRKHYGSSRLNFKDDSPLISDRDFISKRFTPYHARILTNFASYYLPLSSPQPYIKSLIWYRRLLSNTPIIFFIKEKQRLFSESSLNQYNLPILRFRKALRKLSKVYYGDKSLARRARNYHCTDLTTTDLFSLAVKMECCPTVSEEQLLSETFWSSLEGQDNLVSLLRNLQRPNVVKYNGEVNQNNQNNQKIQSKPEVQEIQDLQQDLIIKDLEVAYAENPTKMPYDVTFNDMYILAIEETVLMDNHSKLLDLIEKSKDLEIAAVRVDKVKAATDAMESSSELPNSKHTGTYEQLLKMATKENAANKDNLATLYKRLGEWGLLKVEENKAKTALYLFK